MTNKTNFKSLTPNLMVEDVTMTIDYYVNVLDFQKVMSLPETGELEWAMLSRDKIIIMLQSRNSIVKEYPKFKNIPVGGSLGFYVETVGLDDLYDAIKNKAKVVAEPHTTFYGKNEFAIEDCNGYLLTFAEERKL